MCTSHCNQESIPVDSDNVPWTAQLLLFWHFISLLVNSFLTSANDSENFSRLKVYFSNSVVLGVTEIEEVLVISEHMTHSLRMVKASFFKSAINQTYQAFMIADDVLADHSLSVKNNYSIVSGVRNNKQRFWNTILLFYAHHFSRKLKVLRSCIFLLMSEGRIFWLLLFVFLKFEWNCVIVVKFVFIKVVSDRQKKVKNHLMTFSTKN